MRGVRDSSPPCEAPGCDDLARVNGYCRKHWERQRHRHRPASRERIIGKRSRDRACKALIDAHRAEYDRMVDHFRETVTAEYDLLAANLQAREPVRLLPGPRPADHEPEDRVQVTPPRTFCHRCLDYHANGHECATCATRPAVATAPDLVRLIYTRTPDVTAEPFITDGSEPCAQADPEEWFPEKGGSTKAAKAGCHSCSREVECLLAALQRGERHGVWGGQSERERRALAKELGIHAVKTDADDARRMVAAGRPVPDVAAHFEVSEKTVYRWLADQDDTEEAAS